MEIKTLSANTIYIKGKKESLFINPSKELLESSKYESRIVIYTSKELDELGLRNDKVVIRGPGEYEVGGVEIVGLNGGENDAVYTINFEGVSIGLLGAIKEGLSDKKIERINGIDLLLSSIEKREKVDAKQIVSWAKKWGVNYLIPWGYEDGDDMILKFLDETDEEGLEAVDSIKVDKDNLPDGMEVVLLKKIK